MDKTEEILARSQALEQRLINDWKRLLATADGRRVVWNLLQVCNFRSNGFVPNAPDATAFNCGKIAVALYIEQRARKANAAALEQMEQEYAAEIKQINKELATDDEL